MINKSPITNEISQTSLSSQNLLEKVLTSLGGKEELKASLVIEAHGIRSIYGESFQYQNAPQPVAEFTLKRSIKEKNIRNNWNVTIFKGTPITKNIQFSEIINDQLGYIVGIDNWLVTPTTNIPSGRVASIRKQILLCNPHLILSQALQNVKYSITEIEGNQSLGEPKYNVLEISESGQPKILLFIDPETYLISKLKTLENDHLWRDITLEVTYDNWQVVGQSSLSVPMDIMLIGRGEVWYEEHRTSVNLNLDLINEFTFPTEAKPKFESDQYAWGWSTSQFVQMWCTFGVSKNEQQLKVEPIELAKGVYFIQGAMYNSIVVDQGSSAVVIEAPLYPERSEAVKAWIKSTLEKPISHLVVTHHHFDHSGGIRAYIAAGVPVMVAKPGISLIEKVAEAASTVVPDTQEKIHARPSFLPIEIDDLGTIEAGSAKINKSLAVKEVLQKPVDKNIVYAFRFKTSHANDAMLIVIKTPKGQPTVLFQSDMFNPDDKIGRSLSPIWAIEFAKEVKKYGLNNPNTILCGGHAGHAPVEQLFSFVKNNIPFMFKGYVFFQSHKNKIKILAGLLLVTSLLSVGKIVGLF